MANEIQWTDASGLTEYVNLTDTAGQWWNAVLEEFEGFNAANWTDYDVAATEFGTSGVYVAAMPLGPTGIIHWRARRQAGGSPAQSDTIVDQGWIDWSGSFVRNLSGVILANESSHGGPAAGITLDGFTIQNHLSIDGNLFANGNQLPWNAAWDAEVQSEVADELTSRGYSSTVAGRIDEAVSTRASQTSVDDLPTNSELATALDPLPTANENADALIGRNIAGGSSTGRTVGQALAAQRNKVAFDVPSAGQFTVYATDDVTPLWTGTYTTAAGNPVTAIDPA
jgi:hypothetical protein